MTTQYAAQLALRAQVIRDSQLLWETWPGTDKAGWERMAALATVLVDARARASAGIAGAFFERAAQEHGIRAARAIHASPPVPAQITRSLAVTGLVGVIVAVQAGKSVQAAKQVGFVRFAGATSRLVLSGGRETMLASVAAVPHASWERVTGPSPCEFCANLAAEPSPPEAFPAHDHCSCSAEPVFA